MIDTDKYEGHTPGPWLNHSPDDPLAHRHDQCDYMVGTYEKDKDGNEYFKLIADWAGCVSCLPDANHIIAEYPDWANARLIADAPLLLEEVKRLREVIDKEHPTFDWSSRQTIANLEAEVKRLRQVIWEMKRDITAEEAGEEE